MITANQFFKSSFETYRLMVIMPAMERKGIKQQSFGHSTLQAYVNHGRWVVKCECGGAEKAWEEGWFMCLSCFNAGHKHKYLKSVFPLERLEIEELLEKRPLRNRNWFPGETVSEIKDENKKHEAELLEVE